MTNCVYIGSEALSHLSRKEVLEFIDKKSFSGSAQKVVDALYAFIGYTEDHDIRNFKQKIKSGMVDFVYHLKNLNLEKVSNSNYFKARRALRNLREGDIESEGKVVHALFKWFCVVLDIDPSKGESTQHHQEEEKRIELTDDTQQEVHQEDSHFGSETPVVTEESPVKFNTKSGAYLGPTLSKNESTEVPVKQTLAKDESTISRTGPQDWQSLGNYPFWK